jgi:hypothetical protein
MSGDAMGLLFVAAAEAELEVARLYELFSRKLSNLRACLFFERLGGEERSHGAMIRVLKTLWEARPQHDLHEGDLAGHLRQIRNFTDEIRATRQAAETAPFELRWALVTAFTIETSEVSVLLDYLVGSLLPTDLLRLGFMDEIGTRPDDHVERILEFASQMEREQPGVEASLFTRGQHDLRTLRSQLSTVNGEAR